MNYDIECYIVLLWWHIHTCIR